MFITLLTVCGLYLLLWFLLGWRARRVVGVESWLWRKGPPPYSDAWSADLKSWGHTLKQQGVQRIVFVHGTFVGDDPFDILRLAKALTPSLSWRWWRYLVKSYHDGLMRDAGNFTSAYVRAFQNSTGIAAERLTWGSGNHHMARIRGLLKLVKTLAEHSEQHIVLVGHSHAGQLFALLTQLRHSEKGKCWDVLERVVTTKEFEELRHGVEQLEDRSFDMITLGMPVRYEFLSHPTTRLVHVINHRGRYFLPAWSPGVPWAWHGDIVQHIGASGSDGYASLQEDRMKNDWMDKQLDVGLSWRSFLRNIVRPRKLPNSGRIVLVDYKDRTFLPFSPLTIFGHGSYTRLNRMHFNMSMIIKLLYPQ